MNDLPPKLASMSMEDFEDMGQEKEHEPPPDLANKESIRLYQHVLDSIEDMTVHLKPLLESGSDEDLSSSSSDDWVSGKEETQSSENNVDDATKSSMSTHINGVKTSTSSQINGVSTTKFSTSTHINGVCLNHSKGSNRSLPGLELPVTKRTPNTNSSHHKNGFVSSRGDSPHRCVLSRPMQRKLFSLLQCQLLEEEGQARSARIARSLGERVVTELLLLQQFPHQLSSNLWAAVRTRGCQFLGPAMQEEVLKLILLALENGSSLSRKVLVLFVVQKLEVRYPQASKTAIGHVVQLLYRASCFKVQKRDGESSLMQLKEEFRQYEALRREHDSQIVQIALEAGLRISPEQWSSLLYGDVAHKPHMQSIIDKHQSPQSFSQNIAELMSILQKNPGGNKLLSLRAHLEFLSNIDPSPDSPALSWENLGAVMRSANTILAVFVEYLTHHTGGDQGGSQDACLSENTRYKTSMCRDFSARGTCPRGPTCTFAHTKEEMEKYRLRSRKNGVRGRLPTPEKTTSSLSQCESQQLRQVQLMSNLKDEKSGQLSQTASPGGKQVGDAAQGVSQTPGPGNHSWSPVTSLSGNSSPPTSVSEMKLNPESKDSMNNLPPTTQLTFSPPALNVAGTSNPSTVNQQASLHPNNPYARPFYPLPPPSGPPPPPTHFPGNYSSPPPHLGSSVASLPVNRASYQPGEHTGQTTYPCEDFNMRGQEESELYPGVLDQMLQHQQQSTPGLFYPVQQQASLRDLCDIIRHVREESSLLDWHQPTSHSNSHQEKFPGPDTVLTLNRWAPTPVSDMLVATRSTQSLDKLGHEDCEEDPPHCNGSVHHHHHQRAQLHLTEPGQVRAASSCTSAMWPSMATHWLDESGDNRDTYNTNRSTSLIEASEQSLAGGDRLRRTNHRASREDFEVQQQMTVNTSLSSGRGLVSGDSEFSHFPIDDGDENFIPFDQRTVSRFGPISRLNKARPDYMVSVQASAHSLDLGREMKLEERFQDWNGVSK